MMKLGLHTAILAACSFEQVVDYAASVGFKTLEEFPTLMWTA